MERWRKTLKTRGDDAFRCVGEMRENRRWARQVLKCLEYNAEEFRAGRISELPDGLKEEVRGLLENPWPTDPNGVPVISDPRVWNRLAILWAELCGVELPAIGRWRREWAAPRGPRDRRK